MLNALRRCCTSGSIHALRQLLSLWRIRAATPAMKNKINVILRGCGQEWGFSERKGQRDTRPSGNESRALV
eukprot:6188101-Pleurochrysis_carterae.AAC.2